MKFTEAPERSAASLMFSTMQFFRSAMQHSLATPNSLKGSTTYNISNVAYKYVRQLASCGSTRISTCTPTKTKKCADVISKCCFVVSENKTFTSAKSSYNFSCVYEACLREENSLLGYTCNYCSSESTLKTVKFRLQ